MVHIIFLYPMVNIKTSRALWKLNVQNPDWQEIGTWSKNCFIHDFFFSLHQFIIIGLTQLRTRLKMRGMEQWFHIVIYCLCL
jgi:hypothetical protein